MPVPKNPPFPVGVDGRIFGKHGFGGYFSATDPLCKPPKESAFSLSVRTDSGYIRQRTQMNVTFLVRFGRSGFNRYPIRRVDGAAVCIVIKLNCIRRPWRWARRWFLRRFRALRGRRFRRRTRGRLCRRFRRCGCRGRRRGCGQRTRRRTYCRCLSKGRLRCRGSRKRRLWSKRACRLRR